jgi:hypothetical protein
VRGLNGRARRNVVQEFLVQERATLICIQETKLSTVCNSLANEILGPAFDYDYLPAVNVSGGILLGWDREFWILSDVNRGRFTLSARITETGPTRVHDGSPLFMDHNLTMRRSNSLMNCCVLEMLAQDPGSFAMTST